MDRIVILGSGQSGLQLRFGLLRHYYDVTMESDRIPEQWRSNRRPNRTGFLFDKTMQNEGDLGFDL